MSFNFNLRFAGIVLIICAIDPKISFSVMGNPVDVETFFPLIKGNLTKLTWAHAVNNKTFLNSTLNDNAVMMIEADVSLGTVDGTGPSIPIMAHPPINNSDISLQMFLDTIQTWNKGNKSNHKGVKLDFKTIEAFEKSAQITATFIQAVDCPIWINADIIKGPVNATTTPVDATAFLKTATNLVNTTLSIGWTTNYVKKANYTQDQINDMLDVIKKNNVSQPITFPVRAGIAANSIKQMKELTTKVKSSTLTIWSSTGDQVDVDDLRNVIFGIGLGRVFVDVPKDLMDQLRLDETNSGSMINTFGVLLTVFAGIFFNFVF